MPHDGSKPSQELGGYDLPSVVMLTKWWNNYYYKLNSLTHLEHTQYVLDSEMLENVVKVHELVHWSCDNMKYTNSRYEIY